MEIEATFLFLVSVDISQTTEVGNMTVMCYMQQNCLNIHLNSYMILILDILKYTKCILFSKRNLGTLSK